MNHPRRSMKRSHSPSRIGTTLIAVLISLLLTGCGDSQENGGDSEENGGIEKIGVATLLSLELNMPMWVAMHEGYFADEGLDVEPTYLAGGVPVRDATNAGSGIDLGLAGVQTVLQGKAGGMPLKVIATWYDAELWDFVVAEQYEGEIESLADLKGHTIVTAPPGSVAWAVARAALAESGLDPDKDVKLITLPDLSPATWLNVLKSGQAAAAVTWEPFITFLTEQGAIAGESLLDLRSQSAAEEFYGGPVTTMSVFARDEILQENPEMLQSFLKGIARGVEFIRSADAETLAEIVAPNLQISAESALMSVETAKLAFISDIVPSQPVYDRLMEFYVEAGVLENAVPFEDGAATDLASSSAE